MPWEVVRRGATFVVVKKGSGDVVGRHKNRRKANRQVSLLYSKTKKNEE